MERSYIATGIIFALLAFAEFVLALWDLAVYGLGINFAILGGLCLLSTLFSLGAWLNGLAHAIVKQMKAGQIGETEAEEANA